VTDETILGEVIFVKALITGGTGFVGTQLASRLLKEGFEASEKGFRR
jgi:GDP-D-mannose dehydratase